MGRRWHWGCRRGRCGRRRRSSGWRHGWRCRRHGSGAGGGGRHGRRLWTHKDVGNKPDWLALTGGAATNILNPRRDKGDRVAKTTTFRHGCRSDDLIAGNHFNGAIRRAIALD